MGIVYNSKSPRKLYYGNQRVSRAFAGSDIVYVDADDALWDNQQTTLAVANGKLYIGDSEIGNTSDWVDAGLRRDGSAFIYYRNSLEQVGESGFWRSIKGYGLISKSNDYYRWSVGTLSKIDTSDIIHEPWDCLVTDRIIADESGALFYYSGGVVPVSVPDAITEWGGWGRAQLYSGAIDVLVGDGNLYALTYDYEGKTAEMEAFGHLNDGGWSNSLAYSVGIHNGELIVISYHSSDHNTVTMTPLQEEFPGLYPDVASGTRWVSVAGVSPHIRVGSASSETGQLFAVTETGELWGIALLNISNQKFTTKFPGNNWHSVRAGYEVNGSYYHDSEVYAVDNYGEVYLARANMSALGDISHTLLKLG